MAPLPLTEISCFRAVGGQEIMEQMHLFLVIIPPLLFGTDPPSRTEYMKKPLYHKNYFSGHPEETEADQNRSWSPVRTPTAYWSCTDNWTWSLVTRLQNQPCLSGKTVSDILAPAHHPLLLNASTSSHCWDGGLYIPAHHSLTSSIS